MAQQAKPTFTVATRFWEPKLENLLAAVEKLRKWADAAWAVGAVDVLIAINVKEDAGTIAACKAAGVKAHFMAIENWGKFVPSLNAMLYETNMQGVRYIMYASAEFPVQQSVVDRFTTIIDTDIYPSAPVIGAVFGEHDVHNFPQGEKRALTIENAGGSQVPWNTMAMWRVAGLMAIGGFPGSGDWPADPTKAGVEEYDALAVMGKPGVLVEMPDFIGYKGWSTDGWDEARHALHAKKIASKNERPAFRAKQTGFESVSVRLLRAVK